MCDASSMPLGFVLGGGGMQQALPSHILCKQILKNAQRNNTITEQELLMVVYVFQIFWAYLLHIEVIVHIDHAILSNLMEMKDIKLRLIRWVMLVKEFDMR